VVEEERRQELLANLRAGDVIKGRVRSIRDYGAFVDLGGVDGLVHVSEMAWYRVRHPKELLKVGDEVEVEVLEVDPTEQRIRLTRKPFVSSPWNTVDDRYKGGQLVEGRIVRIVSYGAFVELEPGIEGLLHTSQLARNPVADPREIVKENEVHLLRILSIDKNQERIRLSLKAVTPREQIEWMSRQRLAVEERVVEAEEEEDTREEEAIEDATDLEELDAEGAVEEAPEMAADLAPEQPETEAGAPEPTAAAETPAAPEAVDTPDSESAPTDSAA
jgi:4-hydroxy-3-methylbut-2-enyl diphosphate reductase